MDLRGDSPDEWSPAVEAPAQPRWGGSPQLLSAWDASDVSHPAATAVACPALPVEDVEKSAALERDGPELDAPSLPVACPPVLRARGKPDAAQSAAQSCAAQVPAGVESESRLPVFVRPTLAPYLEVGGG